MKDSTKQDQSPKSNTPSVSPSFVTSGDQMKKFSYKPSKEERSEESIAKEKEDQRQKISNQLKAFLQDGQDNQLTFPSSLTRFLSIMTIFISV